MKVAFSRRKLSSMVAVFAVLAATIGLSVPAFGVTASPGVASGNGVTPVVSNGRPTCATDTQFNWSGTSGGTQQLAAGRTVTVNFYSATNKPPNPAPGKPERYFRFTATNALITQVIVSATPDSNDESNVYTYSGATSDTKLHPPANTNSQPYSLTSIRFCWTVPITLSGQVFHDNDNDGVLDTPAGGSVEAGLSGWTVTASPGGYSAVTNASGDYQLTVPAGTRTVCVTLPDPVSQGGGATSGWVQSTPVGTQCNSTQGGYTANYQADTSGLDFGATEMWTIPAGGTATQTGGAGEPSSIIDLTNCDKNLTAVFDLGINSDEGNTQFVVFGGADLGGNCKVRQTINWAPYDVDYDGDGNLVIPPTLVLLDIGGGIHVLENCAAGEPNNTGGRQDCRVSRTVTESADLADPPGVAGTQDAQINESEIVEFVFDVLRSKN